MIPCFLPQGAHRRLLPKCTLFWEQCGRAGRNVCIASYSQSHEWNYFVVVGNAGITERGDQASCPVLCFIMKIVREYFDLSPLRSQSETH